jgi:hypothetical protein
MRTLAFIACIWLAQVGLADDGFKPLFDGKTFTGWEGNLSVFRIEDGAVVGGSLKANVPHHEYLCTTNTYRDFEVRLKFKLLGANVNGGVQFRSERVPKSNEMIGYQADMGQSYWGCLYDERRHKLLTGPKVEEQKKLIHRDDWNDYVIRAEGRHVQLWLNGTKTVDYMEPDESIPQEGVFGLQIHQGTPAEAWYKDIVIRELSGTDLRATVVGQWESDDADKLPLEFFQDGTARIGFIKENGKWLINEGKWTVSEKGHVEVNGSTNGGTFYDWWKLENGILTGPKGPRPDVKWLKVEKEKPKKR